MAFLSPLAGLIVLAGLIPVAAFLRSERARRKVTALLAMPEPPFDVRVGPVLALVVIAALIGLAATQPTVVHRTQEHVRTDAEAWFVLDTSLSMKAAAGPHSPTRFQRAQSLAVQLRDKLGDVPVGLASITDRVLPHLFPTADHDSFALTVRKVMGIERPPPTDNFNTRITTLGSIARVADANYFSPSSTRRLVVVFTDGETRPFVDDSLGTVFRRPPGVHTIFVHIWGENERVWDGNQPDPLYRPDPGSNAYIQQLAATSGGVAVDSSDLNRVVHDARSALGQGPSSVLREDQHRLALAPYLACICFLPLGFLLWRRNV